MVAVEGGIQATRPGYVAPVQKPKTGLGPKRKLTDEEVWEIRRLRKAGLTFAYLSKRFCVTEPTVAAAAYATGAYKRV